MERPGKLNKIFDNIPSESDDPRLSWEQASKEMKAALESQRKRRRRIFAWVFSCIGAAVLITIIYQSKFFQIQNPQKNNEYNPIERSVTMQNSRQESDAGFNNSENYKPESSNKSNDNQYVPDVKYPASEKDIVANSDSEKFFNPNPNTSVNTSKLYLKKSRPQEDRTNFKEIVGNTPVSSQGVGSENIREGNSSIYTKQEASSNIVKSKNRIDKKIYPFERLPVHLDLLKRNNELPSDLVGFGEVEKADPNNPSVGFQIWAGPALNNWSQNFQHANIRSGALIEIGLRIPLGQKYYFAPGLAYSLSQVQTNFVERRPVRLYRPGTIDTVYNFNTGQQEFSTTDTIPGERIREFRHRTRLHQMGIPLQLGITRRLGRFLIQPEMGIIPMIFQSTNGLVAENTYEVRDISSGPEWRLDLTYSVAVGVEAKLGKGFVGLRYRLLYQPNLNYAADRSFSSTQHAFQFGYRRNIGL